MSLSCGRNLYGYAPYPDEIIDGFFRNAVASGLDVMRIFDALNDVDNVKSSVKSIKKYGGMADCAVCYTVDPKYDDVSKAETKKGGFFSGLFGKKEVEAPKHELVFTDAYFVNKAKEMLALGADMITIKDMSGLIPPSRVATNQFMPPSGRSVKSTFGKPIVTAAPVVHAISVSRLSVSIESQPNHASTENFFVNTSDAPVYRFPSCWNSPSYVNATRKKSTGCTSKPKLIIGASVFAPLGIAAPI